MAPVSFNDLSKTAADILNNDFQTSGYQFKSKQKTSFNNAVVTTAVDLWPGDGVQTPGKLTWKIPNPFGLMGFSIDKFEFDKGGKFKLEAGLDNKLHKVDGLKVDIKSDLVSVDKATACMTYTGVKDCRFQVEAPVTKPDAFNLEGTWAPCAPATIGIKFNMASIQKPDLGVRFTSGPLFAAVLATKQLKVFSAFAAYTVSDVLKVAANADVKEKDNITGAVAVQYNMAPQTTLKLKVTQDQLVSVGVKQDVQKGFTVTTGLKYDVKKGSHSYGLSLSVE
eukprot:TRINITY_DN17712_c0_g1_i1.p2 TRINITY_DN17712_c0_g1~~TRINITY_DN17712_c0_g1_i1.p2  ORF type:complete len:309 (+),score=91.93 TRINITY_DN17712_c0_g1_i1:89-928(+)